VLSGNGIVSQTSPQTFSASCTTTTNCNASTTNGSNFNGTAALALPLASFSGPGIFNLIATLSGDVVPETIPDAGPVFPLNTAINGTLSASWNGTVSVAYTYDAPTAGVPEPASL